MWLDAIWETPDTVRAQVSTRLLGSVPCQPLWPTPVNLLTQVHSTTVLQAPVPIEGATGDAWFTTQSNVVLGIKTADCLPILLAHQDTPWIAAVHAGWKGLYNQILPEVLKRAPIDRSKITVWIGPHIHQEAYAVDNAFKDNFIRKEPALEFCFKTHKGQIYCSLLDIALYQLQKLGVGRVSVSPCCTAKDSGQFFSHRQGDKGRLLTCIWLENH